MARLSDLIRDSKLETHFEPHSSVETVHTYNAPDPTSRRRLVRRFEHWKRQNKIGGGSYGSVWLEKCTKGSLDVQVRAIKQIEKHEQFTHIDYTRELEAIAKFSHARYERCFVKSFGWYESPEHLFIAMEYLGLGDLHTYLYRKPALPEHEAREVTYQILDGLNLMHENEFLHRDLKPSNILLKSCPPDEWWVKIADFGISKRTEEGLGLSTTVKGTLGYIAPEVYGFTDRGSPYAVDIWAVGEITFQMLTKKSSFKHIGMLSRYVVKPEIFPSQVLLDVPVTQLGVDFILSIMNPNPDERVTAEEALQSEWMAQALPNDDVQDSSAAAEPTQEAEASSVPTTEPVIEVMGTWNTAHEVPWDTATITPATEISKVPRPQYGVPSSVPANKPVIEDMGSWNTSTITPATERSKAPQLQSREPSTALALWAYTPDDAGDLALQPKDRIQEVLHINDEWWHGRNERTNMEGIFPQAYVVPEEKKPVLPTPVMWSLPKTIVPAKPRPTAELHQEFDRLSFRGTQDLASSSSVRSSHSDTESKPVTSSEVNESITPTVLPTSSEITKPLPPTIERSHSESTNPPSTFNEVNFDNITTQREPKTSSTSIVQKSRRFSWESSSSDSDSKPLTSPEVNESAILSIRDLKTDPLFLAKAKESTTPTILVTGSEKTEPVPWPHERSHSENTDLSSKYTQATFDNTITPSQSPSASETSKYTPPSKRSSIWSRLKRNMRRGKDDTRDGVFGVPLTESIPRANVAISLTNEDGESYIYGYVPIVVAKCGVFLKENGTDERYIFDTEVSTTRMKELQYQFDSPPRYGKGFQWSGYTVHEAAFLLLTYLKSLPEPVINLDFYEAFREPLSTFVGLLSHENENPNIHVTTIITYQRLIAELPPLNRQLLLYVVDILAVFASKSDRNGMTPSRIAAIFQQAMLWHPQDQYSSIENQHSQYVLIFLIENQDHFLVGTGDQPQDRSRDEAEVQIHRSRAASI